MDAAAIEDLVLQQNKECYRRIPIAAPCSIQVVWDALANFNGTQAIYSSNEDDPAEPAVDAAVDKTIWSLEPLTFNAADQGVEAGSFMLHLSAWRAKWLLFAVLTPSSAGGVVQFRQNYLGDTTPT